MHSDLEEAQIAHLLCEPCTDSPTQQIKSLVLLVIISYAMDITACAVSHVQVAIFDRSIIQISCRRREEPNTHCC